jgi:hypothetical protein
LEAVSRSAGGGGIRFRDEAATPRTTRSTPLRRAPSSPRHGRKRVLGKKWRRAPSAVLAERTADRNLGPHA